ncbi:MAG: hypothetical protein RLZ51_2440, partial [Pseudomonadota bacterium]
LSELVCACPWIDQFTLNPVQVDEHGRVVSIGENQIHALSDGTGEAKRHGGGIATADAGVDPDSGALMATPHHGQAYAHLAIHPYPQELEETLLLCTGERVLLRPIRPDDADLERAFIARLSPETLYRRFMVPIKQLSDQMVERFTQIDYDRELALVALQTESSRLLSNPQLDAGESDALRMQFAAVARILPTWEEGVAEFAIVVGDWMHRSGLGRELMLRLIAAARERGYQAIEGVVLSENARMLRFCASLGFSIRANPDDATERLVRMGL